METHKHNPFFSGYAVAVTGGKTGKTSLWYTMYLSKKIPRLLAALINPKSILNPKSNLNPKSTPKSQDFGENRNE